RRERVLQHTKHRTKREKARRPVDSVFNYYANKPKQNTTDVGKTRQVFKNIDGLDHLLTGRPGSHDRN
ncbi:unnamed protein product, partial [Brassica rapa]